MALGKNRGARAIRNMNETTKKFKRWIDRWYYDLGSLDCRECKKYIIDKRDVCLYDGRVMHVSCASDFIELNKYRWGIGFEPKLRRYITDKPQTRRYT